ncbi:MAG TPA: Arm DNA-binding domain-containing protein [Xanthobacteraceae bacterium]
MPRPLHPGHPEGRHDVRLRLSRQGAGKVKWLTLGRYPDMPLAQARALANDARKAAALGGTPLAPKVQRAEAEKKLRPMPS